MTYFATRTEFSNTNHPTPWVYGQVRRLADEFGSPGIKAKGGQTNDRISRKGYLRLVWRSRSEAKRFRRAASEMYADRSVTRLMRNPRPFPLK